MNSETQEHFMGKPFDKIQDHVFVDWREVAIAIIRHRNIHTGLWRAGLQITMNVMMAQVQSPNGTTVEKLPSALVMVENVNLKQMTAAEADELTVDAAKVNPVKSGLYLPADLTPH